MPRPLTACLLVLSASVCACNAPWPEPGNIRRLATTGWVGRQVGCIDLRVAVAHEPLAPRSGTVLAFDFVNRCRAEQVIDFTALTARAQLADGISLKLDVFDPARQIHRATLMAGWDGAEAIEFDPSAGHGAAPLAELRSVCVAVSQIARAGSAASATVTPAADVCFSATPAGLVPAEAAVALPAGSEGSIPSREASLTVGYRRFSRFGFGWDRDTFVSLQAPPRVASDFDVAALQSGLKPARYVPGSLLALGDTATSGARSVGCLDVRVEAVMADVARTSTALAFMIGNRCSRSVTVALGRAGVRAYWASGEERRMPLYDPASEVHEPMLGPRADATELLQYLEPPDAPTGNAKTVCVDVSGVVASETAPVTVPPVCLVQTGRFANQDTIIGHQPFPAEKWARPSGFFRAFFETGMSLNFVDPRLGGPATGSWGAAPPKGSSQGLPTPAYKKTTTLEWDLRYGWVFGDVYAGAMLQAGAGAQDPNVPVSLGEARGRSDNSLADVSVGLLGGYVWTGTSPLRVRTDLALGLRVLGSDAFPPGCGDASCSWTLSMGWFLVEPRLAIDRWISPWWSVSTSVSVDALHVPDFGVGISFTWHVTAYDGVQ
ncbi:MAG: hypothetical protein ACRENE_01675 [Polyangiaceae bacterium]